MEGFHDNSSMKQFDMQNNSLSTWLTLGSIYENLVHRFRAVREEYTKGVSGWRIRHVIVNERFERHRALAA
jgi:hypothetical protein